VVVVPLLWSLLLLLLLWLLLWLLLIVAVVEPMASLQPLPQPMIG
jgi:hypothetical protein